MENSFEQHRERRRLFGDDAASYDEGRPGYPDELYTIVETTTGIGRGRHVLEVGPGTGQATGRLLDLGAAVTAVELSPELAARLVEKHPGRDLEAVVDSFENARLPTDAFDMVAAATSFHWVPPDVGVRRSADLLRSQGWIALWWNIYGDAKRPDPFHDLLTPVLERLAPELIDVPGAGNAGTGAHPHALDVEARIGEIDATGLFGPVQHEIVAWTGRHTAAEIRLLFASFSPWLALDPGRREAVLVELEALALEDFDDVVERPYLTPVYLAQLRR